MLRVLLTIASAALLLVPSALAQQGPPPESVDKVAEALCKAEQQKLGAAEFTAKYGSAEGCKQQKRAEATQILQAAAQECRSAGQPGSEPFKSCVQEKTKAAVGGGGGGSGGSGETQDLGQISAQIATKMCENLRTKLGADKFADKYGSLDGCKQELAAKAEALAKAAAEKCKGAADKKACFQAAVQEAAKSQQESQKQEGAAKQAEKVAQECASLQQKLGAEKFEKKFGSLAGCKEQLAAKAKANADKCKNAADRQACLEAAKAEQQKSAQTGKGGKNGGADVAQIAAQMAAKMCEAAREKLGAEKFEEKYGSPAGCKEQLGPKAEGLAKSAAAKCKDAADKKACFAEEVKKAAKK